MPTLNIPIQSQDQGGRYRKHLWGAFKVRALTVLTLKWLVKAKKNADYIDMAICHYNKNVDHKMRILLHQAT